MTYHTSRDAIERTIASVEAVGADGLAIAADLSRADQAENAVAQVVDRFGRLDALVNMASVFRRTPLADSYPARLRRDDRRQPRRAFPRGRRRGPADAHAARPTTASRARS